MKTLTEYVKENRNREKVLLKREWEGELYRNTEAVFYDVKTNQGEKSVFAFISYPFTSKPKGGYPAVVLLHGGNGSAFYEISRLWADKGYVAIAPDFNGCYAKDLNVRNLENKDGGPKGYGSYNDLYDDNNWAYFSVLSAMRAVDVLQSLSIVNKDRICSVGLSWGGFLNLLLVSQDMRIKSASIIYSSAFINESEWGKNKVKLASMTEENQNDYDKYIDPKNYLKRIKCPVYFTGGTMDPAFKMENRRKTAEKVTGKTFFGLRKEFPHGNFYGFDQPESFEFCDCILRNKTVPQPKIFEKDGKYKAVGSSKDSSITLHYTKDDVIKTERQMWKSKSIKSCELWQLPKGATAFFITEKTKDLMQWSTNLFTL